jgi:RNA polymerase sigma-70 factor (ECF subfamily)
MTNTNKNLLLELREDFLRFVERRVRSREEAEEILQIAYLRSVEKADMLRGDENVIGWFRRVLANAVVDAERRRRVAQRTLETFAHELVPGATPLAEEDVCRCVTRLLATLKPEYRAALRAVDVEGASVRSFADAAGITTNNAVVRLHRARRMLARRVRAVCGSCARHGCRPCTCRLPLQTTL